MFSGAAADAPRCAITGTVWLRLEVPRLRSAIPTTANATSAAPPANTWRPDAHSRAVARPGWCLGQSGILWPAEPQVEPDQHLRQQRGVDDAHRRTERHPEQGQHRDEQEDQRQRAGEVRRRAAADGLAKPGHDGPQRQRDQQP